MIGSNNAVGDVEDVIMAVGININSGTGTSFDFEAKFSQFTVGAGYEPVDTSYGYFNALSEWIFFGPEYTNSTAAAVFDPNALGFVANSVSGWTYLVGNLYGSLDTIQVGAGVSNSSSTNFNVIDQWMEFDFGGVTANGSGTAGHEIVYGFMTGDQSYLQNYLNTNGIDYNGGAGNDTLYSYDGNDSFTGNAGNDTFVFNDDWGTDVVTDFGDSTGDIDVLDLTGITAIYDLATLQAHSNYTSGATLQIFDGTDTLTLNGYAGTDLATLWGNGQILV
jgi:hypothetical protein